MHKVKSDLSSAINKLINAHIFRYTSGNPFCCRYAMILCPRRVDVLMI